MNRDLKGAAYHEAAHAVVGTEMGWTVVAIDISSGDGAGRTVFKRERELPFRDRVAVCFAGVVGQDIFDAPTHSMARASDYGEAAVLLEGLSQTTQSAVIRAGKRRAAGILKYYRVNVDRVAKGAMDNPKMDGATFLRLFLGR
jgi:hypothetical protein